jgi:hypothetical protein
MFILLTRTFYHYNIINPFFFERHGGQLDTLFTTLRLKNPTSELESRRKAIYYLSRSEKQ